MKPERPAKIDVNWKTILLIQLQWKNKYNIMNFTLN